MKAGVNTSVGHSLPGSNGAPHHTHERASSVGAGNSTNPNNAASV